MSLHVIFVVAGVEYALPVDKVLQMETFSGATAVPGTPDYVIGIVTVRGRVLPVLDMRLRFGLPAQAVTLDTRIIVTHVAERTVALCVDSAREVLSLNPAERQVAPDMVNERSAGFVQGMHAKGSRLLLLIDLPKVLGEREHDHEPHILVADEAVGRPALPS